ncbi:MAG TPA: hypothetical protein VKA25_13745, partial [Gemmatimonadales bacterium]|nr:hypothetical protein [Gemmatimonadales bacterium]
ELEHRWEVALRELRRAEETLAHRRAAHALPEGLTPEERGDFLALGPQLPVLWRQPGATRAHKQALLRCLIDKVVLHRMNPRPHWHPHHLARRRCLRVAGRAGGACP